MKTNSLILGAAVLMLATACSNDEVVQTVENSRAIGFSTFVNKATRAVDNNATTLKDAKVYGVSIAPAGGANSAIFPGTEIKKADGAVAGDESVWAYTGETQYWINGFSYTFAAVAPATADVTVNQASATEVNGGINSINFTNDGQTDLLYDTQDAAAGSAAWGQLVPFELKHILSRVVFKFTNNVKADFKVEVSELKLTNAYSTATFTPADNQWECTGTKGDFNFTEETLSAEYNGDTETQPTYLIPVNQGDADAFKVEFKVAYYIKDAATGNYNDKATKEETLTATLPAMNFQLGYSYAFNTVLTWESVVDPDQNPIEFTVKSVAEWTPGTVENEGKVNSTKK